MKVGTSVCHAVSLVEVPDGADGLRPQPPRQLGLEVRVVPDTHIHTHTHTHTHEHTAYLPFPFIPCANLTSLHRSPSCEYSMNATTSSVHPWICMASGVVDASAMGLLRTLWEVDNNLHTRTDRQVHTHTHTHTGTRVGEGDTHVCGRDVCVCAYLTMCSCLSSDQLSTSSFQ